MKHLFILLTLLPLSGWARMPKMNNKAPKSENKPCTFMRHQYVSVEGEKVPKELENKILNAFSPEDVMVIKENAEFNLKACTSLHPLKKIKDVPLKNSKQAEEHIITKVTLEPKDGFWLLNISSYARINEKTEELKLLWGDIESKSPKSMKDIKNIEVADWVLQRVRSMSSK